MPHVIATIDSHLYAQHKLQYPKNATETKGANFEKSLLHTHSEAQIKNALVVCNKSDCNSKLPTTLRQPAE